MKALDTLTDTKRSLIAKIIAAFTAMTLVWSCFTIPGLAFAYNETGSSSASTSVSLGIPTTYTRVHAYYTNGHWDGEYRDDISGKNVGDEITVGEKGENATITKVYEYANEDYDFIGVYSDAQCCDGGTLPGADKILTMPYTLKANGNFIYLVYNRTTSQMITVTWLDEDGNQIDQKTIREGEDYKDKSPNSPTDTGKWGEPVRDPDTGNITITWEEEEEVIYVTVTWVDEDGTEVLDGPKTFPKGGTVPTTDVTPSKAEDEFYTYKFAGWERSEDENSNVTYTATYTATPKPAKVIVTVKYVDEDDNVVGTETVEVDKGSDYDVTDKANTIPEGYVPNGDPTGDPITGTADSDKTINVPVKVDKFANIEFVEMPTKIHLDFRGLESLDEIPADLTLHYAFTNSNVEGWIAEGTLSFADAVKDDPNPNAPKYERFTWDLGTIMMPKAYVGNDSTKVLHGATTLTVTESNAAVNGYWFGFGMSGGWAESDAQTNEGGKGNNLTTYAGYFYPGDGGVQDFQTDFFNAYMIPYAANHFFYNKVDGEGNLIVDNWESDKTISWASTKDGWWMIPVFSGSETFTWGAWNVAKLSYENQYGEGKYILVRSPEDFTVTKNMNHFDYYYVRAINVTWKDGYTSDGEDAIKTETIKNGSDYSGLYPTNPERINYEFNGWSDPVINEEGNITITAQWEEMSEPEPDMVMVTVRFVDEDDNVVDTTSMKIEKDSKYDVVKTASQMPEGYEANGEPYGDPITGTADDNKTIIVPVKKVERENPGEDPVVPPTPTPGPDEPVVEPSDEPTTPDTPGTPDAPPTPAPAAVAAPAPVVAIDDDANPLAQAADGQMIEDEEIPMSAFDEPHCWVHILMIIGIILTVIYSVCAIARRKKFTNDLDDFEQNILGDTQKASYQVRVPVGSF